MGRLDSPGSLYFSRAIKIHGISRIDVELHNFAVTLPPRLIRDSVFVCAEVRTSYVVRDGDEATENKWVQ